MHESSLKQMEKFFDKYLNNNDKILDVGSQRIIPQLTTYRDILPHDKNIEYIGLDVCSGENVDLVVKDPYKWEEINNDTFDVVISGQAFEHIEFFWLTFLEMTRVIKNNGKLCVIAPSREVIHKFPVDCWRFHPDGMKALAKYANIKVLKSYIFPFNRTQDCIGIFEKV